MLILLLMLIVSTYIYMFR